MNQDLEKVWKIYAQRTIKRNIGNSLVKQSDIAFKLGLSTDAFYKKLRRGQFTAGFFLAVLEILNIEYLNLKEIKKNEEKYSSNS